MSTSKEEYLMELAKAVRVLVEKEFLAPYEDSSDEFVKLVDLMDASQIYLGHRWWEKL